VFRVSFSDPFTPPWARRNEVAIGLTAVRAAPVAATKTGFSRAGSGAAPKPKEGGKWVAETLQRVRVSRDAASTAAAASRDGTSTAAPPGKTMSHREWAKQGMASAGTKRDNAAPRAARKATPKGAAEPPPSGFEWGGLY